MTQAKHRTKIHLLILFIVFVIVHLLLFNHYGIRIFHDTIAYTQGADFLLEHGTLMDVRHLFYSVPIALVAATRFLVPGQVLPYIILQCIISGLATLALYKAAGKLFNDPLAGLFSGLMFLLWLDAIHWNTVLLTESLLVSVTLFTILLLTHFKGSINDYVKIGLLMLLIFFIRPTGVIVGIATVAFLVKYNWYRFESRPLVKYGLLSGLLIVGLLCATLMFRHWDFTRQYEKGNIITYADVLEKDDRHYNENLRVTSTKLDLASENTPSILKIAYFVFHNPLYVLKTGSLKAWYLVSFTRPYYTKLHNFYSVVWLSFIYIMLYWGFKRNQFGAMNLFVATVIVVNCSLIAIASIDWDNRFYMPMEPGIVLLAGGGCACFVRSWRAVNGDTFTKYGG